jgi:hydroxymethylbilane synthase
MLATADAHGLYRQFGFTDLPEPSRYLTRGNPGLYRRLAAERAFTRALGASCQTPVGAHAVAGEAADMELTAFVGLPDGSEWVRDRCSGAVDEPEALGRSVAERMSAAGARDVLRAAEGHGEPCGAA